MARRQHCEYPGCLAFAVLGTPFCHEHQGTEGPAEPADLPYWQRVQVADEQERQRRRQEFEARLDAGDYAKLYTPAIAQLIEQAAREKGVDNELGALRVVLAEVVETVDDPTDKARLTATLARAIVLTLRGDHLLSGRLTASLQEAMVNILEELDGDG